MAGLPCPFVNRTQTLCVDAALPAPEPTLDALEWTDCIIHNNEWEGCRLGGIEIHTGMPPSRLDFEPRICLEFSGPAEDRHTWQFIEEKLLPTLAEGASFAVLDGDMPLREGPVCEETLFHAMPPSRIKLDAWWQSYQQRDPSAIDALAQWCRQWPWHRAAAGERRERDVLGRFLVEQVAMAPSEAAAHRALRALEYDEGLATLRALCRSLAIDAGVPDALALLCAELEVLEQNRTAERHQLTEANDWSDVV